jgi:hypothetical protein
MEARKGEAEQEMRPNPGSCIPPLLYLHRRWPRQSTPCTHRPQTRTRTHRSGSRRWACAPAGRVVGCGEGLAIRSGMANGRGLRKRPYRIQRARLITTMTVLMFWLGKMDDEESEERGRKAVNVGRRVRWCSNPSRYKVKVA